MRASPSTARLHHACEHRAGVSTLSTAACASWQHAWLDGVPRPRSRRETTLLQGISGMLEPTRAKRALPVHNPPVKEAV
jgi:hypothetical protein